MNETLTLQELIDQANQAYQARNYLNAASLFEAVSQTWLVRQEELNAAESLNNASVAYLQAGHPEKALEIVRPTIKTFQDAKDIHRLGLAYGNLAAALEACDKKEEAFSAYQQAADLLLHAGDNENRLQVLQAISALQLKTGKQIQALSTMQSALEDLPKPSLKQKLLLKLLKSPWQFLAK